MEFPDIELTAHTGEKISPSKTPRAIVYFFPRAFTQGCTKETIRFNELYDEFLKKGYEVYGVSTDGVETLRKFAERYRVRFKLLSDEGGDWPRRWVYLNPAVPPSELRIYSTGVRWLTY